MIRFTVSSVLDSLDSGMFGVKDVPAYLGLSFKDFSHWRWTGEILKKSHLSRLGNPYQDCYINIQFETSNLDDFRSPAFFQLLNFPYHPDLYFVEADVTNYRYNKVKHCATGWWHGVLTPPTFAEEERRSGYVFEHETDAILYAALVAASQPN